MEIPPLVVLALIVVCAAATCLAHFIFHFRSAFDRSEIAWVVAAVLGTLIWRWPPGGEFFHGLEYEDAYVYSVVGRQMLIEPLGNDYLTTVCAVGSLEHCQSSETYSGHYLGYPYLLWLAARVVGYSPFIGNYVAVLASALSAILIFLITRFITNDRGSPVIAALVFAWVPVFSVHGVASFAEPMSNVLVVASLYFFLSHAFGGHTEPRKQRAALLAFGFVTALAISIKRENALLPLALPSVAILMHLFDAGRVHVKRVGWVALTGAMVLVYAIVELRIAASIVSEVQEYNGFSFRLSGLADMLPAFVSAFGDVQWYLGTVVLVVAGFFVVVRERGLPTYPAALFFLYLFLYATHVRSYYQLNAADVLPEDALRYAMNLAALWSVIAGCGGGRLLGYVQRSLTPSQMRFARACGSVGLIIAATISYGGTRTLRDRWVEDEYLTRVEPALAVARIAAEFESVIITAEPLMIQMYCQPDLFLIDLPSVDSDIINAFSDVRILFLEQPGYKTDANLTRYKKQTDTLSGFKRLEIQKSPDYTIYELVPARIP